MTWPNIYLFCLLVGGLWSVVSLLAGMDIGHGHFHFHHHGHHGAGHHGPAHHGHSHFSDMLNPSSLSVFLAWFGGIGYLLTRHSGLELWIDFGLAAAVGLLGAWLFSSFLRFLQKRERPLNPADYEMTGVLGQVSCPIRACGVGEVIYLRDGGRRLVPARSEENIDISRGQEVIVTRYEKGIAYVRTWEAMTRLDRPSIGSETLQKEN
jgi:membrane protein implicated in regulation of membrane protease activity